MPEARDRISRAADVAEVYARRRRSIISGGTLSVYSDDAAAEVGPTTPFRWGSTPLTGPRVGSPQTPAALTPSPRRAFGRRTIGSPPSRSSVRRVRGGAGVGGRSRGGRRASGLPDWYPRVPLQDISSIVRAIERRRARLREGEGPQVESPEVLPRQEAVPEPRESTPGARLEHASSSGSRGRHVSVPKILFDITKQNDGDMAGLTPQKKLLNSIDTFEEVVSEELKRMKKTPAAKKAEREKKVKILMSMR